MTAFGTLQRFTRRAAPEERCELCGAVVSATHEHLVDQALVAQAVPPAIPNQPRLLCVCQACAILFSAQTGQRYKRVPSRILSLPDFQLTDAQWESLLVPINMAFFLKSSVSGRVTAVYPSPAGATESQLPLETWDEIVAQNPELDSMQPDVEALLVNRLGARRGFPVNQYFLVPIDQCFKLVGLVRANWRGLSGGEELWQVLERYFAALERHHA